MALDPQGAALMVPNGLECASCGETTTGWLGRKGARCIFLKARKELESSFLPTVATTDIAQCFN